MRGHEENLKQIYTVNKMTHYFHQINNSQLVKTVYLFT